MQRRRPGGLGGQRRQRDHAGAEHRADVQRGALRDGQPPGGSGSCSVASSTREPGRGIVSVMLKPGPPEYGRPVAGMPICDRIPAMKAGRTWSPWPSPTPSRCSSSPYRARSSASTGPTSSTPGTSCACARPNPARCGPRPRSARRHAVRAGRPDRRGHRDRARPATRAVQVQPPAPLVDALRQARARGARIVSICSGAYLLAAAGLLDGRRATTHWMNAVDFAHRFPRVRVDPTVLYIDDGDVFTSAGTGVGHRPVPAPGAPRPRHRGRQRGGPPDGGARRTATAARPSSPDR